MDQLYIQVDWPDDFHVRHVITLEELNKRGANFDSVNELVSETKRHSRKANIKHDNVDMTRRLW
jgi:hypothetical protein